jgi:hypothetical protein
VRQSSLLAGVSALGGTGMFFFAYQAMNRSFPAISEYPAHRNQSARCSKRNSTVPRWRIYDRHNQRRNDPVSRPG